MPHETRKKDRMHKTTLVDEFGRLRELRERSGLTIYESVARINASYEPVRTTPASLIALVAKNASQPVREAQSASEKVSTQRVALTRTCA